MAASAAAPPWLHDADLAAQKHEEAVAVAVEKCADDTKGQTCYICLDDDAEEGLVRGCACRGAAGFVHVSCLAEQAKILVAEAEENNLGRKAWQERWARWHTCRLCEQGYHGVVACALGWACWKTYVGRPETDIARCLAMGQLGNGLTEVGDHEEALSVQEAELAMMRRVGVPEEKLLIELGNLAITYYRLGKIEGALRMRRDVYSGNLKFNGEQHEETLRAANNYAVSLNGLERFEEAKSLLRRTMPVARRVLGTSDELTLMMKWNHAEALYRNPAAALDDLREAVTTHEDAGRIARRVMGCANPLTMAFEDALQQSRAALRARESPPPEHVPERA